MDEELLGGIVTAAVRVGNTVRRPVGPWTDAADALLEHVSAVGFTGAPRPLGRDDLHTATASFVPPASASWKQVIVPDREKLICHNDPAPWNLVKAPDRWVFIDWDFAGRGSRLWDLACNAQTSAPLHPPRDVATVAPRLRALVDGYDLDGPGRSELGGRQESVPQCQRS